jgi:transcriptional regulator with XRE-family HTH domain
VADGTGQRIARARRRRGLSQAVVAGLVGRSESWLSQVERGVRPVDSHAVLTRLAEVLRTDISELTSPDGGEGEQGMYEAAAIEQAMLDYSGAPADDAPGHAVSLDHLAGAARAAYAAYQAARYDEADRLLPALIREAEAAARAPGGTSPGACEARAVAYDVTAALLHRVGAVQPRHRAPLGYQPEDGRQPPVRRLRQAAGQRPNPTSGSYYDEGHWTAEGACSGLRRLVGASHRTLSTYLTTLRRHGLWLDGLAEPLPHPGWDPAHDAGRQPVFLVARCIKLPSADITQVRQSLVRKSAGVVDGFDGVAEVVADSASPSATG